MKTFLAFLLITVAVTLASDLRQEWEDYKVKYNRQYDADEDARRFEIFSKNKQLIDEHNAKYEKGEVTWEMVLNKFADRTPEEIRAMLGYRPPPVLPNIQGNVGN